MEVDQLISNNLKQISCKMPNNVSCGISGLSGSGKSTFCLAIANESIKRVVTLLPKSEYRFLFSDKIVSNYSAQNIKELPLVFYLGKSSCAYNPRSTVGTHTGIFKDIRKHYADFFGKTTEFFSFNNSINWCNKCKGKGVIAGAECKYCFGSRYDKDITKFKINILGLEYNITDINNMSVESIFKISSYLHLSDSTRILLNNMIDLNIGYLSLNRIMSTLSGGETVRLLLAEFITLCRNSLIIIDEISIGLDHNTLINVIKKISPLGYNNQIWLIDHSNLVLDSTKSKIFFGPGSGSEGGQLIKELPNLMPNYCKVNDGNIEQYYNFNNLKKRNINLNNLNIPKNRITTITGESGCGKSTLIKECIIPEFKKKYKNIMCELIGQDQNQSITSRSTVATFLDIKKHLEKYNDILNMDLYQIINLIDKNKYIYPKIKMLIDLGLGYLSCNRKVNTLSTGEFQCLHLVSKICENNTKEALIIFDEPSKGLSQNILNLFMKILRKILQDDKKSILIIEHNEYILKCSDYIIDFGKRSENVKELNIQSNSNWIKTYERNKSKFREILPSIIRQDINGIEIVNEHIDELFNKYEKIFKGGILKYFSSTARWIYRDYESKETLPVIVLDLEEKLYSKDTFLFEVAGVVNSIVQKSNTHQVEKFDFYCKQNLCECCKGKGYIDSVNFELIVKNRKVGLWDGLLPDDVMNALKKYNFSKIKFLFKEIKKETGYDLAKAYDQMSLEEKNIFLYGYWKSIFYDKTKKTNRQWKGIIKLIFKYMRSSTSKYKEFLNTIKGKIVCPICNGSILNHDISLCICNKDIRKILIESIDDNWEILKDIDQIKEIVNILSKKVFLNKDVSTLSIEKQVTLKIMELKYASFLGYTIVLKNVEPFKEYIKPYLKNISINNKVMILDYLNINQTKTDLLNMKFGNNKIKSNTYVYELFGYKKIGTEINKIRRSYPCKYCKGKKVLREDSIFEGVNVTETPCHACLETGISEEGLNKIVKGIDIRSWVRGSLKLLDSNLPKELWGISPTHRVFDLSKRQLQDLKTYLEE